MKRRLRGAELERRNDELCRDYARGMAMSALREKYRINDARIYAVLKAARVTRKGFRPLRRSMDILAMVDSGKSQSAVARELGISLQAVGAAVKRARKADPIARIDALPAPRAVAVATTLNIYADAEAATGKVTMAQLEAAGAFGRKTILKHIRAGILPAEKARVNGKEMWLFEPEAVKAYLDRAADLLEEAVYRKKNRPKRVTAPEGYLSIMDAAEQCAVSHWTLRQHLAGTGVATVQGRHAAKMIAERDLPKLQRYFATLRRATDRVAEPAGLTPRGKVKGGPYFDDFATLFAVMRAQPEISANDLVALTGCTLSAARRWKDGSRVPGGEYRGPLIGLFRQMFNCRLSPELAKLAGWHRRKYMAAYMARRRDNEAVSENRDARSR